MTTLTRHRGSPVLLIAAVVLAWLTGACDPVEPGSYFGNSPAPLHVRLPDGAFAGHSGALRVDVRLLRDHRNWLRFYDAGGPDVPLDGRSELELSGWGYLGGFLDVWNVLQPAERGETNVAFGQIQLLTDEEAGGYTAQLAGVVANHLLVVSATDTTVWPFGPGGPSLEVKRGFQMFHRTCDGDEVNHLEPVPLDTVVDLVPLTVPRPTLASPSADWIPRSVKPAIEDYDDYVSLCGRTLAVPQLGQVAQAQRDAAVMSFAWAPSSDAAYFISGEPMLWFPQDNAVMSLDASTSKTAVVSNGTFMGPLQVATGGTSLLVYSYRLPYQGETDTIIGMETTRISLAPSQLPAVTSWGFFLLEGAGPVFTKWPERVLSPDGNTIATTWGAADDNISSTQASDYDIHLLDVATAIVRLLSNDTACSAPHPLAWAPAGDQLLVDCSGPSSYFVAEMALDGTVSSLPVPPANLLPSGDFDDLSPYAFTAFWTASGPQELHQYGAGVWLYNIETQQATPFIEAERTAPSTAPTQVVVATNQVFAWAEQCFGLGETMCNAELRRLSIDTGKIDVVATAPCPLVFAASPDGTKLVLADDNNVYLKPLGP